MTPLEPLLLAPAAFLAGVLMFLAPCTLPLVPAYLAFIAGKSRRILPNAFAFVIGFSLVFVMLGAFAGFLGVLLAPWRGALTMVAGAILVFFGLLMLGVRVPFFSGQKSIALPGWLSVGHPSSSFVLGGLFALGWSPCVGPVLGTVLLFASTSSTAVQGALLLGVFSLGLAIPFLLTALVLDKAQTAFARWAGFTNVLSIIGGLVLVGLGALMLTGNMALLVTWGYGFFEFIHYGALLQYL